MNCPGHPSAELGLAYLPAVSLLNAGQRPIISSYDLADMLPELNLSNILRRHNRVGRTGTGPPTPVNGQVDSMTPCGSVP